MMKYSEYFVMTLLGIILFYAFIRFIDPTASNIAQGALGFYLLCLLIKNPDKIRRDPMCILFIGVIISQIATWSSVSMFHPEVPENDLAIDKLGKLFLFIPIAWGLQRRQKWIPVVFLTACAGFATELFIVGSDYFDQLGYYFFEQVESALDGLRVDFGIRNAQHPSMVFGVMVILSIFYMAEIGRAHV
jgi:O-antigen ligase